MSNNNIDDIYHLLTQINEGYTAPLNARYNDLIIEGNLTVNGETTVLNTTTVELEDPIIMINKTGTGNSLEKSGLEVERGALTNQRLIFDESDDKWKAGLSGSEQNITLSSTPLTQGSIPYADASGNLTQNNSGLFYSGTNLGLGTASPSTKLHITDNPVATGTQMTSFSNLSDASVYIRKLHTDASTINTYGGNIFFGDNGGNNHLGSGISGVQTGSDDDQYGLAFFSHVSSTSNSTVQETMRINHNGDIGIGNNSPEGKLHVQNAGDATLVLKSTNILAKSQLRVWSSFDGNSAQNGDAIIQLAGRQFGLNPSLTPDNCWYIGLDASADPDNFSPPLKIGFKSGDWGVPSDGDVMTILKSGNVGIATTNPQARLHIVQPTASTGDILRVDDETNDQTYFRIAENGHAFFNGGWINMTNAQFATNGNDLFLRANNSDIHIEPNGTTFKSYFTPTAISLGADALYINSSKNVGIGTTSPSASAILDLTSTTKGFLPPRTTSASITTPVAGLTIYDTGLNNITLYNGTSWVPIPKPNFFNVYYSNVSAENSTTTTITSGTSYFRLGLGSCLFKGESNLFNINGNFMSCKYVGATTTKNSQHAINISYLADTSCITTWIVYKNAGFTGEKITSGTIMYDSRARQSITNNEQNNISISFMDAPSLNDTYHVGVFHSHGNNVVITPSTFNWMVHSY